MTKQHQGNIAVIGCGRWGQNLVRNFNDLGALYAIHDINPEVMQKTAAQFQVASLPQEAIFSNPNIQGIVIAVPSDCHYLITKQALMAGKHVFVEKPMTMVYQEAKRLVKLAETHKCLLMVGHLLLYHAAFRHLKEMVSAGQIGKVHAIYANRLIFGGLRPDEDCLWDYAPHDLSMILSLENSAIQRIEASSQDHIVHGHIDTVTINLKFASGVTAKIFNSWHYPYKEQKLIVVGEKGSLVFDDTMAWGNKLTLIPHRITHTNANALPTFAQEQAVPIPLAPQEPLRDECNHFVQCIKTGEQPLTGVEEAITVMGVVQQINDTLQDNSTATISEYPRAATN